MNDSMASGHEATPYEDFLAATHYVPSAGERERWVAQHSGDPEEPRALVDAGWAMAHGGQPKEALALFRRAAEFGGEYGRDGQVGVVDQLHALERGREADAAQQVLRAALDSRPGGHTDLRIYHDMVEVQSEAGQYESALEWCQAGLDRATGTDDASQAYRRGMLLKRGALRDELEIKRDDEDLAAEKASTRPHNQPVRTTASGTSGPVPRKCCCGRLLATDRAGAIQGASTRSAVAPPQA
jgi:tetratricopeptide (TPR) repeat protein